MAQALHPLRLSYTMFADDKPWMGSVERLATGAASSRRPVSSDNPFLRWQTLVSDQITAGLTAYQVVRDGVMEQVFFGFYGSPFVKAMLGIPSGNAVRPPPGPSPEQKAMQLARSGAIAAHLEPGGFDAAVVRTVLFIVGVDAALDQRCVRALSTARHSLADLSLAAFKALVRNQICVLALGRDRAMAALPTLVPTIEGRQQLSDEGRKIVETDGHMTAGECERLAGVMRQLGSVTELVHPQVDERCGAMGEAYPALARFVAPKRDPTPVF